MSLLATPVSVATKATPHASCSLRGSYRPWALGSAEKGEACTEGPFSRRHNCGHLLPGTTLASDSTQNFTRTSPDDRSAGRLPVRLVDDPTVQLRGQGVDGAGDFGVGLELELLLHEVMVGLGLLEVRLPVLPDHDERRQEDRLERDDQG